MSNIELVHGTEQPSVTLLDRFMNATEGIENLNWRPNNDILCQLYGLYKQVYYGDCGTPAPTSWNVKAKMKWESWIKNKGKSQSDAIQEYISLAQTLTNNFY